MCHIMRSLLNISSVIACILQVCHALSCSTCYHMGGLSVKPGYTHRARLVLDLKQPHCDQHSIQCAPHEDYCFRATAQVHRQYWVYQGCLHSAHNEWHRLFSEINPRNAQKQCSPYRMTSNQTASLPGASAGRAVVLQMCVCRNADDCNMDNTDSIHAHNTYSAAASLSHSTTWNHITFAVFIAFICLYSVGE